MNRTFEHERQKFKHVTYTATLIITKFFTGVSHCEWAFVGGPMTSPNKSKMVDGGHIELHKKCKYLSMR